MAYIAYLKDPPTKTSYWNVYRFLLFWRNCFFIVYFCEKSVKTAKYRFLIKIKFGKESGWRCDVSHNNTSINSFPYSLRRQQLVLPWIEMCSNALGTPALFALDLSVLNILMNNKRTSTNVFHKQTLRWRNFCKNKILRRLHCFIERIIKNGNYLIDFTLLNELNVFNFFRIE